MRTYDAISEQWIDESAIVTKSDVWDSFRSSIHNQRDMDAQDAIEHRGAISRAEEKRLARSELSTIMQTTGLHDIRGE